MSAFRFRLQTPLRLARARRGELRRELASRLHELAEVDAELRRLGHRRQAIDDETSRRVAEGIDGVELARLAGERCGVDREQPPLLRRHEAAAASERQIRERLAAISREVQVLENLQSEARLAWHRDRLAQEQSETDDMTLVRRGREAVLSRRRRDEP